MQLYIFRHGQTTYNSKGMVQGRGVDSSLNERGVLEAQLFYKYYGSVPFDLLVTSTLKRTIETAQFFEKEGLPVVRMRDLEEIDWGVYEGKVADDAMRVDYQNLLNAWSSGDYEAHLEQGDSARQMGERLQRVVDYFSSLDVDRVLVCTHGGCLGFLMTLLQNLPLSQMPTYRHHNTGLCLFDYDGQQFKLIKQDDLAHLKPLELEK
jgi:probable phosphoglycerate mutase